MECENRVALRGYQSVLLSETAWINLVQKEVCRNCEDTNPGKCCDCPAGLFIKFITRFEDSEFEPCRYCPGSHFDACTDRLKWMKALRGDQAYLHIDSVVSLKRRAIMRHLIKLGHLKKLKLEWKYKDIVDSTNPGGI